MSKPLWSNHRIAGAMMRHAIGPIRKYLLVTTRGNARPEEIFRLWREAAQAAMREMRDDYEAELQRLSAQSVQREGGQDETGG